MENSQPSKDVDQKKQKEKLFKEKNCFDILMAIANIKKNLDEKQEGAFATNFDNQRSLEDIRYIQFTFSEQGGQSGVEKYVSDKKNKEKRERNAKLQKAILKRQKCRSEVEIDVIATISPTPVITESKVLSVLASEPRKKNKSALQVLHTWREEPPKDMGNSLYKESMNTSRSVISKLFDLPVSSRQKDIKRVIQSPKYRSRSRSSKLNLLELGCISDEENNYGLSKQNFLDST